MRRSFGERLIGGLGTALVLVALGAALLIGLAVGPPAPMARDRELTALVETPPRPRPKQPVARAKRQPAKAAPAPPNLRNVPTEIAAPPPLLIVPPPVLAAPVAATGAALASGAGDRAGPGKGAGGVGNGLGGGGDGSGDGSDDLPPRFLKGRLDFADVPSALREAGVGGTVAVRYHVEIDGRVRDCVATTSSGNAELDALTCRLIERRFRFDPSRRSDGRPVRSTIVEKHSWINDRAGQRGGASAPPG